ncbi:holo-ACP synthase [Acidihalobacter aeolianus]|uniref:Holo-[acyl-carrier-protein] synthase n=1 Tax=Acidihalobacter aeolianus TaxID=2792603 RepID=A0A1D8K8H9_9GAMM|nr:holo-ACP synthase [Acidihalobacter aeolianus]AOV17260.1 holo-ACP synthase [Acidihalobacter aeolianus]
MAIRGIGVDLVRVARLERLHARYGERLAERVLHPDERPGLAEAPEPARYLAKRFAAKEAGSKALGTGFALGVRLRDLRVVHDDLGKPALVLSGVAAERAAALGVTGCHLSLSDEHEHVIALVVLEGA